MKTEQRFVHWKIWAKSFRQDVHALWCAMRHPCAPWYAKAIAGSVVAYAQSPIDLIPDAIPVFGYLDDLILIPLGIVRVRRLISPVVLAECQRADMRLNEARPMRWLGVSMVLAIWMAIFGLLTYLLVRFSTK